MAAPLLLACCGGTAVIGAIAGPTPTGRDTRTAAADAVHTTAGAEKTQPVEDATAPPSTSPNPSPSPSPSPAAPVVRTVTVTQSIPYPTRTVQDGSLAEGVTRVRTAGRTGVRTLTYRVTVVNGVQTARTLVSSVVTRAPVTKVVAVGTKVQSSCDPNYSGACVPIASDVDCAGGGGNGPAYVTGPVKVIGTDIYDLDRDGDGWGCD